MRIKPVFAIGALNESRNVLELLCKYFKCGKIYKVSDKYSRYQVENIKDLKEKIVPHFLKYPLESKKKEDFKIWEPIINEMNAHPKRRSFEEKKAFLYQVVEKAYEMNCNGKRRKQTKEEFIKQIVQ